MNVKFLIKKINIPIPTRPGNSAQRDTSWMQHNYKKRSQPLNALLLPFNVLIILNYVPVGPKHSIKPGVVCWSKSRQLFPGEGRASSILGDALSSDE